MVNAKSVPGAALLGPSKDTEVELLLRQGYEGMKQRAAKVPSGGDSPERSPGAAGATLYDAWGKPERAKEWWQKLVKKKSTPKPTQ